MNKEFKLGGFLVKVLIWLAVIFLLPRGCNMLWNNRHIQTESTETISYAKGFIAHIEYTKYGDGSEDIKKYPDVLGHRYLSSVLYQNFDRDNTIDRIRKNGPEWKMHRLTKIVVRETDYEEHKKEFDKGDELLVKVRKRAEEKRR